MNFDRKTEPEWPEPGWEGHRAQRRRDIARLTTPEERLQWLEEMLLLFKPPPKPFHWPEDQGEQK
jgi:hypothetical protein